MKRLLFFALLGLSSGTAYAEWTAVGGNEEAGVTGYADPGTIRRNGKLVTVWHANDFKTLQIAQGNSCLSVNAQHQYDCTGNHERILALTKFSGNMGNGNPKRWGRVLYSYIGTTAGQMRLDCMTSRATIAAS